MSTMSDEAAYWHGVAAERAEQLAAALMRNGALVAARDAWQEQAAQWRGRAQYKCLTDATDPGAVLVAETRAAWRATDVASQIAAHPQFWIKADGSVITRAESDDPQLPAPPSDLDTVVDTLNRRLMPASDRQRLGRALGAANAPDATDDRREQDAAVNRAFGARQPCH